MFQFQRCFRFVVLELIFALLFCVSSSSKGELLEPGDLVLVTGASGFVGSRTAENLLEKRMRVRLLVRDPAKVKEELRYHPNVEVLAGDLTNRSRVREAISGVKAVVHAAAKVGDWGARRDFEKNNTQATECLLEAASEARVIRFVYVSTVSVYGVRTPNAVYREDSPYTKDNYPYAQTKIAAERAVLAHGKRGLSVAVVRPSWIYGPGDRHFFPEILRAVQKGVLPYLGSSQSRVSLVHIDNLTEAIWLTLTRPEADGETFIVDDGAQTWKWLAEHVAMYSGARPPRLTLPLGMACVTALVMEAGYGLLHSHRRPLLTRAVVNALGNNITFEPNKLKNLLGYKPVMIHPEEAVREAVQSALRNL